jgi:hypothetical protein
MIEHHEIKKKTKDKYTRCKYNNRRINNNTKLYNLGNNKMQRNAY